MNRARSSAQPERLALRRVQPDELERRLVVGAELLELARPHLEWLSSSYASIPHVAYLVDRDGIILYSIGSDAAAMDAAGLLPGYDWSEGTMGTNGAGTALVVGEPVTVQGAEHVARPLHGYTSTGAPVHGPAGDIAGAIDIRTDAGHAEAERLRVVAHAAFAIEQELRRRDSMRRASGQLEVERRLAEERAQRRATLEALRESEARYQHIAANVPGIVYQFVYRPDGTMGYTFVSEGARTVFGIAPEDALRDPYVLLDVIDRDAYPQFVAKAREAAAALGSFRWEGRIVLPSGEERFVHIEARDHLEPGGGIASDGLVMDVTELHRAKQQLRQAQKMEAIGQLAGGIAHDFNNILAAISGFAELLREDMPADDPHRGDIEEILKGTHRASALTRQLLAFSRKQVLQPAVLELNQVIAEVASMLRPLLGATLHLVTLPAPTSVPVFADRTQLEQVLMNLALNARDAMPDGGTLTIELGVTPAGAETPPAARLVVSDTGVGMPPEVQRRAFEPFFTTKPLGRGTGLGLATVHGIVQQSGGTIELASREGSGTTFTIMLPLAAAATSTAIAGRDAGRNAARDHGVGTVLLVEDEEAVRAIAQRVLERAGYRVLTARHGADALRVLSDQPDGCIDVLLSDVVMPEMGGIELAARAMERVPGLRIILMSGYADDHIGAIGQGKLVEHFLPKPFTAESLLKVMQDVARSS